MKDIIEKATVVDVRSRGEFQQDHYPDAINIPLDEIQKRMDEFRKMKSPIVLYCQSGNRSGMAAAILKQYGIKEVYNGGGLYDLMQQKNKYA